MSSDLPRPFPRSRSRRRSPFDVPLPVGSDAGPSAVVVHVSGPVTVIRVAGALTVDTRGEVLAAAVPLLLALDRVVLDLSAVGVVDSTGVAAVYEMRGVLARGRDLIVVPSIDVRVALQLAARLRIVVFHDSVDLAVAAASQQPE